MKFARSGDRTIHQILIGGLLLFALAGGGRAQELTTNIVYGVAGTNRLLLDASVPEGAGPFPVGIVVHGGGWSSGDKEQERRADGAAAHSGQLHLVRH